MILPQSSAVKVCKSWKKQVQSTNKENDVNMDSATKTDKIYLNPKQTLKM